MISLHHQVRLLVISWSSPCHTITWVDEWALGASSRQSLFFQIWSWVDHCPCDDFGFGTTWSHGNSKWKCPISYWLSYMITLWMLKACKTGSSCGGSWRFCTLHKPSFATRYEFGPVQFCHKTRGPQLPNRNKNEWAHRADLFSFTYTRVKLWPNNNGLNLRCSWERLEEQLEELDRDLMGTHWEQEKTKKTLFSKTVC